MECEGYQKDYKWKSFGETKTKVVRSAPRRSPASNISFAPSQQQRQQNPKHSLDALGKASTVEGSQECRGEVFNDHRRPYTWLSSLRTEPPITPHEDSFFNTDEYGFVASTTVSPPADDNAQNQQLDLSLDDEMGRGDQLGNMQQTFTSLPYRRAPASRSTMRISSPTFSIASSQPSDSDGILNHTESSSQAASPEELMQRFYQETCSILSVIDGPNENPWRSLIEPMVGDCPALYHAVLSMAAFHGAHDDPSLHNSGVAHVTEGIRCLASELQDMPLDHAFATSLALSFSEGWDSHVSTGVQHLRAAGVMVKNILIKYRQDIDSSQMTNQEADRIRFLCNTFVYFSVISRLTCFQEAPENDLEEILVTINGPIEDQVEVDPLMGCAMSLFPLLVRVADLVKCVYKTESNSLTLVSRAMELREEIAKWQVPTVSAFERPEDTSCEVQHLIQTAEAYRYAALLYLHQAVPENPSESAEKLAKKVLFKLASVPISSGAILVQIFPLFVASCEVTDPEDRTWVVQRWTAMTARLKIGNIKSCWGVVQELWSRRDAAETEKAARVQRRIAARGSRAESSSSPGVDIPFSLKRKVSSIDAANARNIVYNATDYNIERHQRRPDNARLPRSWGTDSEDFVSQGGRARGGFLPMSLPTNLSSRSQSDATLSPASMVPRQTRRPLSDASSSSQIQYDFTVRGSLHWLNVMADWTWEVFL